jgi:adenine-specific DNA-methyltransferase
MPVKYIPYVPNTIEGQAILDNITRTRRVLRYRDNGKVHDHIRRGLPLYETAPVETVGASDTRNLLLRGECLSACAYLKDKGISLDLVYIDPPFASGAGYAKTVYLRRNPHKAEEIAQAEAELELDALRAFEEKMYGDIWNKEDYLNWMFENLAAIKSVMSETASIYVHLDWHIGHYVKVLLDEVFGEHNFINEIVWRRAFGHSDADRFGMIHDVILFYAKDEKHVWNSLLGPLNKEYVEQFFDGFDETKGERYQRISLSAGGLSGGGYDYEYKGVRTLWRCPQSTLEKYDAEGRLHWPKKGHCPPMAVRHGDWRSMSLPPSLMASFTTSHCAILPL